MQIEVQLEEWSVSRTIRDRDRAYRRWSADQFRAAQAKLKPRQAVFYRNLIRIAESIESHVIPVEFEIGNGRPVFLDRGCIKIAEQAGFIRNIKNGPGGAVDSIEITFFVSE